MLSEDAKKVLEVFPGSKVFRSNGINGNEQEEKLEDLHKEEITELKKEIDKPKLNLRYILHKCPDQGWVVTYE